MPTECTVQSRISVAAHYAPTMTSVCTILNNPTPPIAAEEKLPRLLLLLLPRDENTAGAGLRSDADDSPACVLFVVVAIVVAVLPRPAEVSSGSMVSGVGCEFTHSVRAGLSVGPVVLISRSSFLARKQSIIFQVVRHVAPNC